MNNSEPRVYYVPLGRECIPGCTICASHGCINSRDRTKADLARIARKAKESGHKELLFSSSALERHEEIQQIAKEAGLKPGIQVCGSTFLRYRDQLTYLLRQNFSIEVAIQGNEPPGEFRWADLPPGWRISISPAAGINISFLVRQLEPFRDHIYFHFTPYGKDGLGNTVRDVYERLQEINRSCPGIKIRGPYGREVWDRRIPPELNLEPEIAPDFSFELSDSPEISVVIPTFNSGPLLVNCLRHLLLQRAPRGLFQIVIVDDGSTDSTADLVRGLLAAEAGNLNVKYLYYPRTLARNRGDGQFRAGIARNLGVKHANGKILLFLDSDMIVPNNHLTRLIELHQSYAVVQSVRRHLNNRKSNQMTSYAEVNRESDTYVLESRYWSQFFDAANWEDLPHCWKYTCTYGLSMHRDSFLKIGRFRRTFVFYGFEDTDLGYRLWKNGAKFHLDKSPLYHLWSEKENSEYRKSNWERHLILSKTAKIFFLNNLDFDIYEHLRNFMGNECSLLDWISQRRKKNVAALAEN
jgi:glycosyltransferase involved in cell wall biosynthesis